MFTNTAIVWENRDESFRVTADTLSVGKNPV
jgi:hypothetical protein